MQLSRSFASRLFAYALLAGAASLPLATAAVAQGFFFPDQAKPHAAPAPRPAARPAPRPRAPEPAPAEAPQEAQEEPAAPVQLPVPPVPELQPLPKTTPPPVATIGVIGVPEVMRASTAAQQVQRVIGERRDKLNQDAQKEQAAWRDLQQQLANQRNTLSADQIRARERELQERITNAQKQFRERNRIIQDAAQVALGQIERELVGVIRQVAESRTMNLVLHRAQVALNINEFDITDQVTAQMNKVLPTVLIPPDGQEPTAANMGLPATPAAAAPKAAAAPGK